jgi:acylphosphatase
MRAMSQLELRVLGRVQGVGFRWFVCTEARALGLTGRVWNRPDGTVEVVAEGDEARLRELLEAVRRGPAGARVTDVLEVWSDSPARYRGFEIGT